MCRAQPHQNSVPANRVLSDVPSTVMKSHQNSVPANKVLSDCNDSYLEIASRYVSVLNDSLI